MNGYKLCYKVIEGKVHGAINEVGPAIPHKNYHVYQDADGEFQYCLAEPIPKVWLDNWIWGELKTDDTVFGKVLVNGYPELPIL